MQRLLFITLAASIALGTVPAFSASSPHNYAEIDQAARSAAAEGFRGVLLVKREGEPAYFFPSGASDCSVEPLTRDMRFDMGSITKTFTAAAILRLNEQKILNLDQRLGDILTGVPPDKAGITIIQLLKHQSGLPESLGEDETYISKQDFLKLAMSAPLAFTPGSSDLYSNVGYSVLAAIIEEKTGQSYETALSALVLAPAQTRSIGYMEGLPQRNVCGLRDGKKWGSVRDYFGSQEPSWHLVGNGGLLTTPDDLYGWFTALWSGKILTSQSVMVMKDAFESKDHFDRPILHTGGSNLIFTSDYIYWPEQRTTLILMTDDSRWPKEKVMPLIVPAIFSSLQRNAHSP